MFRAKMAMTARAIKEGIAKNLASIGLAFKKGKMRETKQMLDNPTDHNDKTNEVTEPSRLGKEKADLKSMVGYELKPVCVPPIIHKHGVSRGAPGMVDFNKWFWELVAERTLGSGAQPWFQISRQLAVLLHDMLNHTEADEAMSIPALFDAVEQAYESEPAREMEQRLLKQCQERHAEGERILHSDHPDPAELARLAARIDVIIGAIRAKMEL